MTLLNIICGAIPIILVLKSKELWSFFRIIWAIVFGLIFIAIVGPKDD